MKHHKMTRNMKERLTKHHLDPKKYVVTEIDHKDSTFSVELREPNEHGQKERLTFVL